jgi:hypothetical protein
MPSVTASGYAVCHKQLGIIVNVNQVPVSNPMPACCCKSQRPIGRDGSFREGFVCIAYDEIEGLAAA